MLIAITLLIKYTYTSISHSAITEIYLFVIDFGLQQSIFELLIAIIVLAYIVMFLLIVMLIG